MNLVYSKAERDLNKLYSIGRQTLHTVNLHTVGTREKESGGVEGPQSTYRGRDEIEGTYLTSQQERTPQLCT